MQSTANWKKAINKVYTRHSFSKKKMREIKDERYGVNDAFTMLTCIHMCIVFHCLQTL